jgi:hypothetical protein
MFALSTAVYNNSAKGKAMKAVRADFRLLHIAAAVSSALMVVVALCRGEVAFSFIALSAACYATSTAMKGESE